MIDETASTPLSAYPAGVGRSSVGALDGLAVSYRLVLGQMRSTGRIVALLLLSLTATIAGFAVGSDGDETMAVCDINRWELPWCRRRFDRHQDSLGSRPGRLPGWPDVCRRNFLLPSLNDAALLRPRRRVVCWTLVDGMTISGSTPSRRRCWVVSMSLVVSTSLVNWMEHSTRLFRWYGPRSCKIWTRSLGAWLVT